MQRRLIVMRHAKSDWDSNAQTDHARPLNRRGRRDAPRVAARLSELGWEPDTVISSDAERTRETFELMAVHFSPELPGDFRRSLYHAGWSALAEELKPLPDGVTTVLVLGHNPGWSSVVEWLTEESIELTTANAALCHVDADTWEEAVQLVGTWELEEVLRPKEL